MRRLLIVLLTLAGASLAQAHHGWNAYDSEQPLTVETEIRDVSYRNPHAELTVNHDDQDWRVILAPLSRLASRGLPESDLQPGSTVTIVGYPRKDGTPELRAERIIVEDRTIELR